MAHDKEVNKQETRLCYYIWISTALRLQSQAPQYPRNGENSINYRRGTSDEVDKLEH